MIFDVVNRKNYIFLLRVLRTAHFELSGRYFPGCNVLSLVGIVDVHFVPIYLILSFGRQTF